jgi:hypothetical protein
MDTEPDPAARLAGYLRTHRGGPSAVGGSRVADHVAGSLVGPRDRVTDPDARRGFDEEKAMDISESTPEYDVQVVEQDFIESQVREQGLGLGLPRRPGSCDTGTIGGTGRAPPCSS